MAGCKDVFNMSPQDEQRRLTSLLLFNLIKVRNSLSSTALKSLYYALIHPYFLFCPPVISYSSKNIDMLTLKQKHYW